MKQAISTITVIGLSVLLFIACNSIQEQAPSQVKAPTAGAVSTNDGSVLPFAEPGQGRIERSVPGGHTASETFDFLDLAQGVEVFLNGMPAASIYAMLEGMREAGSKPGDFELVE